MALCLAVVLSGAVSAAADLQVTGASYNTGAGGELFADGSNSIQATINNNGDTDAGAFDVILNIEGYTETQRVISGLSLGSSTTVTFTGYTRNTNGTVNVNVNADSSGEITESNESNNLYTESRTVYNNGYRGKSWSDGSNITTSRIYDLRGGIVYSSGDSTYKSGSSSGWENYTVNWSSSNLTTPSGATVKEAWLYLPYNWDNYNTFPNTVDVKFNDQYISYSNWYHDQKNFGTYPNAIYGMLTYNVTSLFQVGLTNNATLGRNLTGSCASIYPLTLMVIYADNSTTRKQIFINEGWDLLLTSTSFGTSVDNTKAYAPFTGMMVETSNVKTANLHSFAAGAGSTNQVIFNTASDQYNGDSKTAKPIVLDVTNHLTSTDNLATVQANTSGGMSAMQQILVVEYNDVTPIAAFTATNLTGLARDVSFTDQSTNNPGSWKWEYNNGSGWVEFSTEQNPTQSFTPGVYDIRLTATNTAGSDEEYKMQYLSVSNEHEPLSTIQSGVVSGDLYVSSPIVYPNTTVEETFNLPVASLGNIDWARLFVNTYSGSAANTYGLISTVKIDANGDGDFDDPGEILGVETLATASELNGHSYPLNDHISKVYSDYEAWYDVTSLITSANPVVNVTSSQLAGYNFDGRIKGLTLVVAYNDDDNDQLYYWVNHGADWSSPGNGQTTFNTTGVVSGWASAESSIRYISGSDATTYTFNGASQPNSTPPNYGGALNTWDVTDDINAGESSTLAYSKTSGSYKTTLATLKVEYLPDLVVTDISPNVGVGAAFFANEPNILSVTVLNNGTVASEATTLDVDVDGTTYTVDIPALAAGATATVTVIDTNNHTGGSSVPVNANADPSDNIPETNEANNTLLANITVSNNGYKGKQYTDDDELDYMETQETWEGNYDVIYSTGDTAYNGATWTEKTYSWNSSDLVVPVGATVVSARLYQGYTYNKMGVDPSWTLVFNGNTLADPTTYSDIKGFGDYSYPYGLYVYDVTEFFNTAGNSMTITPEPGNNYGIYGAYLIVVYEDSTTSYKKIYINDGFDMLYSRYTYSTTDEEATAYANFEDVTTDSLGNAQAIAILANANEVSDSKFLFNGNEYTGFWNDRISGPDIGFSVYDVTSGLQEGLNEAGMQSYDSTGTEDTNWGDSMYAMNVILVTTTDNINPTVTANLAEGTYNTPQSVTLTATDNMDPNPTIFYTTDGSDPTTSSTQYIQPINILNTTTLKFFAMDIAGNPSEIYTKTYTIDTTSPVVTDSDPNINELNVSRDKVITVIFSEPIKAGTMHVELYNTKTKGLQPITTSINGNILTINHSKLLAASTKYTIRLYTGSLTDIVNNPLILCTRSFTTTSDNTAPKAIAGSPARNAVNVPVDATITTTFNEQINEGNMNIELKTSTGTVIPTTNTLNGNILTITPNTLLAANTQYIITLEAGSITDLAGNPIALYSRPFATDSTAPKAIAGSPARNAVNVPVDATITTTFNEQINEGNMNIELKTSTGTVIPITTSINGNVLTITPTTLLAANTQYTIILNEGSITDLAGNPIALYSRPFATDSTAPKAIAGSPARNAVNVPVDATITTTFNEQINEGNMNIELKTSTGTVIPITTSINGNVLTITPTTLLAANTQYIITLEAGSITDLAGNPIALYSRPFATDSTAPKAIAGSPARNAVNVPVDATITTTFNEQINEGNMNIELKTSTGTVIPITTSINGNVLTITPTTLLAANTQYTIILNEGSITDLAGNPIALYSRPFATDSTAPKAIAGSPARNAVNVPVDATITTTFNEQINEGNMNIELKTSTGTVIPITTSINGNVLTITPTTLLAANTQYTIILNEGSITDLAGNSISLYSRPFTTEST